MGIKKIAILGGGISGLATLHFLKQRFHEDVDVTLYEASDRLGGSIQSIKQDGFLFETGPNGFINNTPATLALINDLDLTEALITADLDAKRRYIQLNDALHVLPRDPASLMASKILTIREKFSLLRGILIKNISTDQSIYDYVSQRFSSGVAEKLADPFIRGIFGGDIRKLHMASAFPKMKKGIMTSLKGGMSQLIERFEERYSASIKKNHPIVALDQLTADAIISTVPAYQASILMHNKSLNNIPYCSIVVVGLGFSQKAFRKLPDGFGFLVPTQEDKTILGVLIESNVYANRAPEGCVMIRVMMRSAGSDAECIALGIKEINNIYGLLEKPKVTYVKVWDKAIPQYDMNYPSIVKGLPPRDEHFILSGNFLKGIAFNDCINNAKDIAYSLKL